MNNNPFSTDWMSGWQNLQRKMWEDWSDVTQSNWTNTWQTENPMNFFREGMKNWPNPFMAPTQTPEAMAMKHAMGSMEEFMRMGREVFKLFQGMSEAGNMTQEWTSQLDKAIQQAKSMFGQGSESLFGAMNAMGGMGNLAGMGKMEDMTAFLSRPMKAWTDFLGSNPAFSNDTMRALLAGGQVTEETLSRFLSVPGVGFNREKQEKIQEGMRLTLEYRKAFEEFQKVMNESSKRALDLLHRKLLEMGAEGKSLQTMRDLYVLWVDCNEEANAATVSSKEYNEINSRMVNAMMRVRRNMAEMMDSSLAAVNMPTRRELDSAHRQISTLRRRVSELEDVLHDLKGKDASAEIRAMRDDMEKLGVRRLREELAELKQQLEEVLTAPTVESGAESAEKTVIKKTVRIGNTSKPAQAAAPVAAASAQKGE
ncbi:MAG: class III poly(R)-hydroxyalkanoic acid synthase subunit PhaE [Magnetococcales bacterium]|nr:class III poly(R)-hydroxyalkanoic acid synthase subunit PhaE [Magnetococcales bacterium]